MGDRGHGPTGGHRQGQAALSRSRQPRAAEGDTPRQEQHGASQQGGQRKQWGRGKQRRLSEGLGLFWGSGLAAQGVRRELPPTAATQRATVTRPVGFTPSRPPIQLPPACLWEAGGLAPACLSLGQAGTKDSVSIAAATLGSPPQGDSQP